MWFVPFEKSYLCGMASCLSIRQLPPSFLLVRLLFRLSQTSGQVLILNPEEYISKYLKKAKLIKKKRRFLSVQLHPFHIIKNKQNKKKK